MPRLISSIDFEKSSITLLFIFTLQQIRGIMTISGNGKSLGKESKMTKFQKDLEAAKLGDHSVLESRIAELEKIEKEGRRCKNKFRMQCLLQDRERIMNEVAIIEEALEVA